MGDMAQASSAPSPAHASSAHSSRCAAEVSSKLAAGMARVAGAADDASDGWSSESGGMAENAAWAGPARKKARMIPAPLSCNRRRAAPEMASAFPGRDSPAHLFGFPPVFRRFSAMGLIAAKPVKPCDGGVFEALNLLLKTEQNARMGGLEAGFYAGLSISMNAWASPSCCATCAARAGAP